MEHPVYAKSRCSSSSQMMQETCISNASKPVTSNQNSVCENIKQIRTLCNFCHFGFIVGQVKSILPEKIKGKNAIYITVRSYIIGATTNVEKIILNVFLPREKKMYKKYKHAV